MKNFAMTGVAGYIAPRHLQGHPGHRQPARGGGRSTRRRGRARPLFLSKSASSPSSSASTATSRSCAAAKEAERVALPQHLLAELPARRAHPARAARRRRRDLREAAGHQSVEHRRARRSSSGRPAGASTPSCSCALHPDADRAARAARRPAPDQRTTCRLTYVTARGLWYDVSWKGAKSSRAASRPTSASTSSTCCCGCSARSRVASVHLHDDKRMAGHLELERADVRWFLSIDARDLPFDAAAGHEDDLPFDHRRRPGDRVQRGLRGPSHARLRRSDGGSRVRHR